MTSSRWLARCASALGCALAGCPSAPDTVTLRIFTDFEPGEQFEVARYVFDADGAGTPSGVIEASRFSPGASLHSATSGARPFTPQRQTYRVELVDDAGTVVATAQAESSFVGRGAQAVTLTLTRSDCESVLGCGDDETCLCGGCYPRACRTDAGAAGCPGECCERAAACDAPPADCADAVCVDPPGTAEEPRCVWVARDGACEVDEWCDAIVGCEPRTYTPSGTDAGVPDARGPTGPDSDGDGSPDALDCDDGNPDRRPGVVDVCENGIDEDCNGSEPACEGTDDDPGIGAAPGRCAARCCDGELVTDIPATDSGDCVRESSPLCAAHGYVLRARWDMQIAYRRERYCWALCCNRDGYHRILDVESGCAELAAEYCADSDRGGLEDAAWAQCQPEPGARRDPCPPG